MTKDEKLAKCQRSFEDWALVLTTANRSGKTLMSTKSMAELCKEIADTIKVLREV